MLILYDYVVIIYKIIKNKYSHSRDYIRYIIIYLYLFNFLLIISKNCLKFNINIRL